LESHTCIISLTPIYCKAALYQQLEPSPTHPAWKGAGANFWACTLAERAQFKKQQQTNKKQQQINPFIAQLIVDFVLAKPCSQF